MDFIWIKGFSYKIRFGSFQDFYPDPIPCQRHPFGMG